MIEILAINSNTPKPFFTGKLFTILVKYYKIFKNDIKGTKDNNFILPCVYCKVMKKMFFK